MNINEAKGDQITIHWAGLKVGKEGTIGTFIVSPKVHAQLEDEFGREISIDFYDENVKGKLSSYDDVIDAMKNSEYGKIAMVGAADESVLYERFITVKRKYTEMYPERKVGKSAAIRNTILEAIKDNKITRQEFDKIVKEMSIDSSRWLRRNSVLFNINEDEVSLSNMGKKVLKGLGLPVNETVTPFKEANIKAEEMFGEFGIATLDHEQLSRIIDIKQADKLAKKYGESSFMALTELDMEKLLNKNAYILIKENKTNKIMKNNFVFESFSDFVNAINESESVNEAFGSMILSSLFINKYGKFDKELAKAFYGTAKIAMDKVQDEDIITTDPATAYKNKDANSIIFYVSDNEKPNPHAPYDAYYDNKTIPGGGYLLAVTTGDNKFYDNAWAGHYSSKNRERVLRTVDNNPSDSIGIGKKYKGWDATGLYNVKRISEVADRAIVINLDLLRQKYSTANLRADRAAAKAGAIAFKSDKDFKQENMNRYETILRQKAASMPLDSMVKDAIDALTEQIKDGLAKNVKNEYGEIEIGKNKRGSTVKLRDASNHMSRILDSYDRYVTYVKQDEESVTRYGGSESWYKREMEKYAKDIKDEVAKIATFDYAW